MLSSGTITLPSFRLPQFFPSPVDVFDLFLRVADAPPLISIGGFSSCPNRSQKPPPVAYSVGRLLCIPRRVHCHVIDPPAFFVFRLGFGARSRPVSGLSLTTGVGAVRGGTVSV